MLRHAAFAITVAVVAGCSPNDSATPIDGGAVPPHDAGMTASVDAGSVDAGQQPVVSSCDLDGGCLPGVWVKVTPPGVNLTDRLSCDNFGAETVQVDPNHPEQLYAQFNCQGIWKSTDYGQTWKGPVNTGVKGATIGDCAGGIAIPPSDPSGAVTIYQGCIRGAATGFSRSTNGGVDWAQFDVNVPGGNQQYYPPVVDPYDPKHLLISGHGISLLAESMNGGETWAKVTLATAMNVGGTGAINFIVTGSATTTRKTWLWIGQSGGTYRTTTAGAQGAWTLVESNVHPGGIANTYQPDTGGVVYMAGLYSSQGFGVFRSSDYGEHWTHCGLSNSMERIVFGTAKNVYAMMGNEISQGSDPALQVAAQPGTGTWATPATPAEMTQGPLQAAVTSDGKNAIIVLASWTAGLWRYVEP